MRSRYNPAGSMTPFTYKTTTSFYSPIREKEIKVKKDTKELVVLTLVLVSIALWVIGVTALLGL